MRTQKAMVLSTVTLLWLVLATSASGHMHGMDGDFYNHHHHHHHHHHHGDNDSDAREMATVQMMGSHGGPHRKNPGSAVDIIVNGPLWALGRKGGPFVVESVRVETSDSMPKAMPIIHQRMIRCPGFMRHVENMMQSDLQSPSDMMLRLVESIPLLQEELETRYSDIIGQHMEKESQPEPSTWWNMHTRCMDSMKRHVSSWWQSVESRVADWSSSLRSDGEEDDTIDWSLWDEQGNLNIGLIIFVALIGLSTAVWSLLMLQLVQCMHNRLYQAVDSDDDDEQFVMYYSNSKVMAEDPPVKQAVKGDVVHST